MCERWRGRERRDQIDGSKEPKAAALK